METAPQTSITASEKSLIPKIWACQHLAKYNVVTFGAGVIGGLTAKYILESKRAKFNLVGVYDIDPAKVGKDLGEVIGLDHSVGVTVSNKLDKVLTSKVDIAIHTTSSYLSAAIPQIESIVKSRVDVISSCEELSYPYVVNTKSANRLDRLAKKKGVTVLGTGINPGFLMDTLPIVLTAPCKEVKKITVTRKMNAATRRVPFQKKIGVGMTKVEFQKAIDERSISGHVGLKQSIGMIAEAIGWKLDEIKIAQVEPVTAESTIEGGFVQVKPGNVCGTKQTAEGLVGNRPLIQLDFTAAVGVAEEYDMVQIEGLPPVNCKISPCVHGDHGTVAMLTNMIPKVVNSAPGLYTMKDLQVPSAYL